MQYSFNGYIFTLTTGTDGKTTAVIPFLGAPGAPATLVFDPSVTQAAVIAAVEALLGALPPGSEG